MKAFYYLVSTFRQHIIFMKALGQIQSINVRTLVTLLSQVNLNDLTTLHMYIFTIKTHIFFEYGNMNANAE